jgi:hypothetical protein
MKKIDMLYLLAAIFLARGLSDHAAWVLGVLCFVCALWLTFKGEKE